jgi:hypothetical protein
LNVTADDDIDMRNTVNLNGGNAGNGGNATATGATAVNVTATGGRGGDLKPKNFASPVNISAGGAINQSGTLNITLGHAGDGGSALANGGAGNPGNPGGKGGDATANGGDGGNTIPLVLHAAGAVNSTGTINLTGGAAGGGGTATHNPGVGGAGNAPGASGGPGGSAFGFGGNGGTVASLLRADLPTAKLPTLNEAGGAAGNAAYSGGNGGDGVVLCPVGGAGGKGGDANGGGGNRGTGSPNGALATVTINGFGNGGNGKQGNGPGGPGGINGVTLGSGLTGPAPATNSFAPGANGPPCPLPQPAQVFVQFNLPVQTGIVPIGTYQQTLLDGTNAVVGSIMLSTEGPQGNHFRGQNPDRIGWTGMAGVGWIYDLTTAIVNGVLYTFNQWTECIINANVDATHPVFIEQVDANGTVIATTSVTSTATCTTVNVNSSTKKIRRRGSGLGSSADSWNHSGTRP